MDDPYESHVFEAISGPRHEAVHFASDPHSGLKTIVAIHSTALGPALGGTRFYPYASETAALRDVLRLSAAMTRKNAAAGLDLGGGKAVIIGNPRTDKTEALLRAYGRVLEGLGGRYITAEDVGTTTADIETIQLETRYATGASIEKGGSGDPSPATARGLFAALKATVKHRTGSDDLSGCHVAIQGIGKVGYHFARYLHQAGARLTVADINEAACARARDELGATIAPVDTIAQTDCDIFAPCALGGAINDLSLPLLRCSIVLGSANNQLAHDRLAQDLAARDILYVPDFLINAGGVINLDDERHGFDQTRANARIDTIGQVVADLLQTAEAQSITPLAAAIQKANARLEAARQR